MGAVITTGLRSMQQRGDLRADADPARLAIVLMAANQGCALLSKASRTSAPLRTAVDNAIAFLRTFAPS
jgi:TetR/AcrR family transcriptional regulator, transcriptional repressor for nem operon